MTAISSTWKPENNILFCDGHNVVLKMCDQIMCGQGFITSYGWSADSSIIDSYDLGGGKLSTVDLYNSSIELNIGIRLQQDSTIDTTGNLVELLTKQLSEFDLIKEVNRRFKEEN